MEAAHVPSSTNQELQPPWWKPSAHSKKYVAPFYLHFACKITRTEINVQFSARLRWMRVTLEVFVFCVGNSESQAGGVLSSWRGNSIIRLHRSNRNGRSRKGWLLWGRDGGGLNRKIAPFFTALCRVADRPVVCFAPNNQN